MQSYKLMSVNCLLVRGISFHHLGGGGSESEIMLIHTIEVISSFVQYRDSSADCIMYGFMSSFLHLDLCPVSCTWIYVQFPAPGFEFHHTI